MNQPPANSPNDAVQITLRPERADDETFLLELYASTRATFIKMQFNAMRQGYASTFPQAQFSIIVNHENPVGRIVTNRTSDEIRLVDLALMPLYRRQGIGSKLLQPLLVEANQLGKPVRLQVLKTNRAARLYARLGFVPVGEDDFYRQMEWRPTANA